MSEEESKKDVQEETKPEESTPATTEATSTESEAPAFSVPSFAPAPSGQPDAEAPLLSVEVEVKTNEEEEEILVKLRAKLYRLANECDPPEWKERGTGDIKLLKHKETGKIRVLMRRDKTLKVCANHYVHPDMILEANVSSDRSWLYKTPCDYSDGASGTEELLAIRFQNVEDAQKWKDSFLDAQQQMKKIMEDALAAGKDSA